MPVLYDLFLELVRCSFLGDKQVIDTKQYMLEPTILRKYDLARSNPEFGSKTQMRRLFAELLPNFKNAARSELYRQKHGWIQKGIADKKIKQYVMGNEAFLVPILDSIPSVGIDTSSDEKYTYVCIALFDNHLAGYHYLENILHIPKSKGYSIPEFKWNKLNPEHRTHMYENLELLMRISCTKVLMIKTNALRSPDEKRMNVFSKLITGWFTNYEYKSNERMLLQKNLFNLVNARPIHCDPDFQPIVPDKIVQEFVKILADGNTHEPLCATKHSHESIPIQITDILCGALKKHILEKNNSLLVPWEFHNKLIYKKDKKIAKCYIWNF